MVTSNHRLGGTVRPEPMSAARLAQWRADRRRACDLLDRWAASGVPRHTQVHLLESVVKHIAGGRTAGAVRLAAEALREIRQREERVTSARAHRPRTLRRTVERDTDGRIAAVVVQAT